MQRHVHCWELQRTEDDSDAFIAFCANSSFVGCHDNSPKGLLMLCSARLKSDSAVPVLMGEISFGLRSRTTTA
jgi:hypothetical protein